MHDCVFDGELQIIVGGVVDMSETRCSPLSTGLAMISVIGPSAGASHHVRRQELPNHSTYISHTHTALCILFKSFPGEHPL